jgi:nucleoside-diphosphate-sugar epimerase
MEHTMSYFVTGATGFMGRFLIARLLKRKTPNDESQPCNEQIEFANMMRGVHW